MAKFTDVIPEGVVNLKEYNKFKALERHPKIRNSIYLSSEGTEINIGMLPHRLEKFIETLSPQEQDSVREMKREYNVLRAKISTAKSMAFGRAGRYAGKTKAEVEVSKLSPFEEDVIELLGRLFTVSEVVNILGTDYGVYAGEDEIKDIFKRHVVEVERKREEFKQRVTDVRLYNKRSRLEELAWMYSKMKARYVAFNGVESYNALLRTLEQIRKEAEGDVVTFNGSLDINIEVTLQNHIQKDILKTINLKEIILGRVAARMNFDTKKLVAGLHNSYYNKFVDISGDYDATAEMEYPSQSAYDFTMIENTAGREVMDVKAEPVTENEKSTADNVKDLFLKKIRKARQDMEERRAGWEAKAEENQPKASEESNTIERGRGRSKDKVPPSRTKEGMRKTAGVDYKTGAKKKK